MKPGVRCYKLFLDSPFLKGYIWKKKSTHSLMRFEKNIEKQEGKK